MDFYEVVGQVCELLRRQGRVSYRALKLQFKLDDDYIEGLKDELIYAQRLAIPYFCTLLAEVSAHLGHPEDGLQALAEAHLSGM